MTTKIDIIVPVYNAKKYLAKCIRSIQKQTFTDWRLILVDDGSTDGSAEICDKFCMLAEDKRISVVHQKNKGSIGAKMTGIENATSEFVTFVDADDLLPPNALDVLYSKAEEYQADIVAGWLLRCNSWNMKHRAFIPELQKKEEVFQAGTDRWMRLMQAFYGVTLFHCYLPTKLYRKEIVKKALDFKTPCRFFQEDVAFNLQAFMESKCVVSITDVVYYYRLGGGTSRFMPDFLNDCISLYKFKLETIQENQYPEDFVYTTSVELKNELWTWLTMYAREHKQNPSAVAAEVERCCNIAEIVEAVNYPKDDNSGIMGFRQMVKEKDVSGIVAEIYKNANNPKVKAKQFVRKLLR